MTLATMTVVLMQNLKLISQNSIFVGCISCGESPFVSAANLICFGAIKGTIWMDLLPVPVFSLPSSRSSISSSSSSTSPSSSSSPSSCSHLDH